MKKILKAAVVLAFCCRTANAEVPSQMNFQGRIELPAAEINADGNVGDKDNSRSMPFTGTGRFRFAIVSSTGAIFWTNVPDEFIVPPSESVSIPVNDGIFNVALGDPALGMPPINPGMFSGADRFLRVFFQGEIIKGNKTKLTAERELLPPQKLLTVPFAFQSAVAQQAIDKQTIGTLLAGATVYGQFAIAQNAVILGSATVYGDVKIVGKLSGGGTYGYGNSTFPQLAFGPEAWTILSTPQDPEFTSAPWPINGGGHLNLEAAGGLYLNQIATGPVSIAAGGGSVLISTPSWSGNVGIGTANPAFKLHISSGAGETGDILAVSTGASDIFRVNGLGEVRASKYYGDGSALTGISGGAASPAIDVTTISVPATTPYGGINITTNVFITEGLSVGSTAQNAIFNVRGGTGRGLDPLGEFPVVMRLSSDISVQEPWTILFEDEAEMEMSYALKSGSGQFFVSQFFRSLVPLPFSSDPCYDVACLYLGGFGGAMLSGGQFVSLAAHNRGGPSSKDAGIMLNGLNGSVLVHGNFLVSGTKSFTQDHPTDPTKTISYYTLEGPESGIYTRGTARLSNGKARVVLPDYFALVASTSIAPTIQLTAGGECKGLFIFKRGIDEIEVRELYNGKSNVEFDYMVQSVRRGYENLPVIQDKETASEDYQLLNVTPEELKNRIRGNSGKTK